MYIYHEIVNTLRGYMILFLGTRMSDTNGLIFIWNTEVMTKYENKIFQIRQPKNYVSQKFGEYRLWISCMFILFYLAIKFRLCCFIAMQMVYQKIFIFQWNVFLLGGIHKLRWQNFEEFWPPPPLLISLLNKLM